MRPNQAAFETGILAQRMAQGYFTHCAALAVATDSRAMLLAPQIERGQVVPVGRVAKKNGFLITFHFLHYLRAGREEPEIANDLERIWLVGSLIIVGDALDRYGYFDRAPELELLRHMRNGVAHGNRFRIDKPAALTRFPAHNKLAWARDKTDFEITVALDGQPVLFDFMGPGDVIDLLTGVSLYLIRMGNGDSLRP